MRKIRDMQKLLEKQIDIANEMNFPPEYIVLLHLEKDGGKCPRCGKEWNKVPVKNVYADFHYYDPACGCYGRCKPLVDEDRNMRGCGNSLHREKAMGVEGCTTCNLKASRTVKMKAEEQVQKYMRGYGVLK